MRQSIKRQSGQGMTEYIIIVALIAVAAIAVYQFFGTSVRSQTAAIAQELSGGDGTASQQKAAESAGKATEEAGTKHSLKSFTGNEAKE